MKAPQCRLHVFYISFSVGSTWPFSHVRTQSLKFETAQYRVWSFHMFMSFLQIGTSRTDGLKILKNQTWTLCLKSLWNALFNDCSEKVGSVCKKTWEIKVQPFFGYSTPIALYAFLIAPLSFKQFLIFFSSDFLLQRCFFPSSLLSRKFNFETFILHSELRWWVK